MAGKGGINGEVRLEAGSQLRPGDTADAAAIGSFSTGNFSLEAGAGLLIDLDPETDLVDQLLVAGSVNLAGQLELNLLSAPELGDRFVFLTQDGVDPVLGRFSNGPALRASFGGVDYTFALDYLAGSGNDVALVAVIPEPATGLMLLGLLLAGRRRTTEV